MVKPCGSGSGTLRHMENRNATSLRRRLVTFLLIGICPWAWADSVAPTWEAALPVSIALSSEFAGDHGEWSPSAGLSLSMGVHLSHDERPYAGGVFADYQLASTADGPGTTIIGIYGSRGLGRWRGSAFVFDYRPPGGESMWGYGTRIGRSISPDSAIALVTMGPLDSPSRSHWKLKYSRDLSARWSLSVSAGASLRTLSRHSVGAELSWQIR